jgi:hypothetical protein
VTQPASTPGEVELGSLNRRASGWTFLRPDSPIPTIAGLVVVGVGFMLILLTWGQVAGETAVGLQLPYIVSGGIVGFGLVMVGLVAITVQYKRHDAAILNRQIDELTALLAKLDPGTRANGEHERADGDG